MATSLSNTITKLKNKTAFNIASAGRVRGVVDCKSCMKPRCIYSLSALSQIKPPPPFDIRDNLDIDTITPMTKKEIHKCRVLAKDKLHDAMESPIFVCGMTPLDSDDSMYDIFRCDPSLDCNTHIEVDFYTSCINAERIELCCHYAGEFNSPVELNSNLEYPEGPYSIVLHVSKVCLHNGCNIIEHAARQNALAKQVRIDVEATREAGRHSPRTCCNRCNCCFNCFSN